MQKRGQIDVLRSVLTTHFDQMIEEYLDFHFLATLIMINTCNVLKLSLKCSELVDLN